MIPAQLERLVLLGKAKFCTFNHAHSAVGVIPVPEGHFIVITGIIYHPFMILGTSDDANMSNNYFMKLRLFSKTNDLHWVLKNYVMPATIDQNFSSFTWLPLSPTYLETYSIHEIDVQIILNYISDLQDATIIFDPLDPQCQNPPAGSGYGTTIEVVRRVVLPTAEDYRPQGHKASPTLGVIGPLYDQQLNDRVDDVLPFQTALTLPQRNTHTPLVNFHYYLINLKDKSLIK